MKKFKGKIFKGWTPTFENVAREFLTCTLYKILFDPEYPNFKLKFTEEEAIAFAEEVLKQYSDEFTSFKEKQDKIMSSLKEDSKENDDVPIMTINNYQDFFELLRQVYERAIELFFEREDIDLSFYPRWEKDNLFENIWLRATPTDFNNPELFLRKQAEMINDKTFEKYNQEFCMGKVKFLNDNILCVKNCTAKSWDENAMEMRFTIYDKQFFDSKKRYKPQYPLPVIRYGIYSRNHKKVCSIGSIQDKSYSYNKDTLKGLIDRKRYKVNEGVQEEDTEKVEPKNVLALSIFINLLHIEGITEVEVPSMYVLDYEYHKKRSKHLAVEFEKDWSPEKIEDFPEVYEKEKEHLNKNTNPDLISEIKTERLMLTLRRVLEHYIQAKASSYPGDADDYFHISVPVVKKKNDIEGKTFKELFSLICNANTQHEIE